MKQKFKQGSSPWKVQHCLWVLYHPKNVDGSIFPPFILHSAVAYTYTQNTYTYIKTPNNYTLTNTHTTPTPTPSQPASQPASQTPTHTYTTRIKHESVGVRAHQQWKCVKRHAHYLYLHKHVPFSCSRKCSFLDKLNLLFEIYHWEHQWEQKSKKTAIIGNKSVSNHCGQGANLEIT